MGDCMCRKTVQIIAVFVFVISGCSLNYTGPSADLVIRNAKVVTIDKDNPRAEAIAIRGDRIIGVVADNRIDAYIDSVSTKVIDAGGRLVIPGFNDAHVHFRRLDPNSIDLRYITDPAIITERVREQVKRVQPGELIRGGRWEHEMFRDKQWPTKELIDPYTPDNPVALRRADGHSVLVNSYVLRHSGITNTGPPDPPGGEIQRDPVTGEPTGIIKELARRLLDYGAVEVELSPEEKTARELNEWQAAFDMAAELGVTSIHLPPGEFEIYDKFRQIGRLTARFYVGQNLDGLTDDMLADYTELRKQYPLTDDWIRFGFLKGHIDGTLGSGTMLVFEPFEDEPNKTGLPFQPYEELERIIVEADKHKFQTAIHAIGPKGNHLTLNALEKAREVNGTWDSRHRIEHSQFLIDSDIPRFADLSVVASMQPTHCITDKRFAEKRVGSERCKGAYAWRSLLNAGVRIAFGTDYGVEPLDPLEGLYAAVTRKDRMGEPGPGWFPEQLLTMEEAIELYTLGAAYAEFMEDRKGMLKEGFLADVVIMNNDLTTINPGKIMPSKVDYTIVGGKVVYTREGAN